MCMRRQLRACILACIVFPMAIGTAHARLVNYEKDSDLELAMKYDSECNGGDRTIASQSPAETHYLAYLERCVDKIQRAKVYSQLGSLFATNWHPEYGERPDYEKAVRYFKKALEEEPNRVGRETIRARFCMLTPLDDKEDSLRIRIENYAWLLENLTKDKVKELWLPDFPGQQPTDADLSAMVNFYNGIRESESINLASEAYYSDSPAENLRHVMELFPGTRVEEECRTRLSALVSQVVRESKEDLARTFFEGVDEAGLGESVEAKRETDDLRANGEPMGAKTGDLDHKHKCAAFIRPEILLASAAAVVAALIVFMILRVKRKANK